MKIKVEYEVPKDMEELFDEDTLVDLAKLILDRYFSQEYLFNEIESIEENQQ